MPSCQAAVDGDVGVRGAGAAGHHGDAGLAGELAVGLGHVRGAAFLAADHGLDVGSVQPVEHGEVAFAGDREYTVDAVQGQGIDDRLAGVGVLLQRSAPKQGFEPGNWRTTGVLATVAGMWVSLKYWQPSSCCLIHKKFKIHN